MAFYFKLKDKVYKSTNKVTIGRGAPFDNLSDDRDIVRAHCKIVKRKNKFFIRRLHKDGLILINGKLIPMEKLVHVNLSDKLHIGNLPVEIMKDYDGRDYTVINRFYSTLTTFSNSKL
jgi:predicted component of type VI protein secretion system